MTYPELCQLPNGFPISFTDSFYLIDHNELAPLQEYLHKFVAGVIDHHVDTKLYTEQCKEVYLIQKCGSAVTLMIEHFKDLVEEVWDHEMCWFSMAPIYLDSHIFSKGTYQVKWIDKDKEIKNFLKRPLLQC